MGNTHHPLNEKGGYEGISNEWHVCDGMTMMSERKTRGSPEEEVMIPGNCPNVDVVDRMATSERNTAESKKNIWDEWERMTLYQRIHACFDQRNRHEDLKNHKKDKKAGGKKTKSCCR